MFAKRYGLSLLETMTAVLLCGVGQQAFAQSSLHSTLPVPLGSPEASAGSSACTTAEGLMTKAQGAAILQELARIESMLAARTSTDSASNVAAPPASPGPARLKIAPDWHSVGREDAPVIIVEFTDLQCPVCQRFHSTTFSRLKADYIDTGKVRFVSRDLPLPMHQYAHDAAVAERCAGAQGKFWEFRDSVLGANQEPTADEIASIGRKIGLDMDVLTNCRRQNSFSDAIDTDGDDAQSVGIHGTPSFVIGHTNNGWLEGVKLLGSRPYPAFQSAIEAAFLQTAASLPAQSKSEGSTEGSKH